MNYRSFLLSLTVTAVLFGQAAWSQDSDTLYRASYCIGVANAFVRDTQQLLTETKQSLPAEFVALSKKSIEIAQKKMSRYGRYAIIVRGPDLASLAPIIVQGERDYFEKQKSLAQFYSGCISECSVVAAQGADDCNYRCLAKKDQTSANIFRCMRMPDDLPF